MSAIHKSEMKRVVEFLDDLPNELSIHSFWVDKRDAIDLSVNFTLAKDEYENIREHFQQECEEYPFVALEFYRDFRHDIVEGELVAEL